MRSLRDAARRAARRAAGEELFVTLRAAWWRAKLRLAPYEPETRLLPRFVRSGFVCVDAGANVGQYTYYLSSLVGRDGVVHSFEPLSYSRRIFERVVRARNVVLHRVALGAEKGRVRIGVVEGNIGEAHVADSGEEVDVVALDDWGATLPRLDFVKIDVEGYELNVLRGAARLIARLRPTILCEIGTYSRRYGVEPQEVFAWFASAGYVASVVHGAELLRVERWSPEHLNYFFTQ